MKSFFKAVERDGSFKKQALSQVGGGGGGGYDADGGAEKRKPNKFMAWNANNFLFRLKSDRDEMLSLLHCLDPDVITIQELQRLLAMDMITYNTDWLAIQQRFLPSKYVHQIFVKQKNRNYARSPENPIKVGGSNLSNFWHVLAKLTRSFKARTVVVV